MYYKPIRPVLDVSLIGIYFLFFLFFFGQTTIKKLVTLGSCSDFFVRLGNISLSDAWPSEQRQPTTFQPIRTDIRLVPH